MKSASSMTIALSEPPYLCGESVRFLAFAWTCTKGPLVHNLLVMRDQMESRVPKWAFFLSDLLLLGTAFLLYWGSNSPLGLTQAGLICLCMVIGAALSCLPFVLDYRLTSR